MLCNIKPVPFHESDKHIFAKIPGGGGGWWCPDPRFPPPLDPPMEDIVRQGENAGFSNTISLFIKTLKRR